MPIVLFDASSWRERGVVKVRCKSLACILLDLYRFGEDQVCF